MHNDVKRGCLGSLSTNKVVGKEVLMATNQKFIKIQDIIYEVNSIWGEEHEEKRKRILLDNTLKLPLYAFFVFSLIYFSVFIINFHL